MYSFIKKMYTNLVNINALIELDHDRRHLHHFSQIKYANSFPLTNTCMKW